MGAVHLSHNVGSRPAFLGARDVRQLSIFQRQWPHRCLHTPMGAPRARALVDLHHVLADMAMQIQIPAVGGGATQAEPSIWRDDSVHVCIYCLCRGRCGGDSRQSFYGRRHQPILAGECVPDVVITTDRTSSRLSSRPPPIPSSWTTLRRCSIRSLLDDQVAFYPRSLPPCQIQRGSPVAGFDKSRVY